MIRVYIDEQELIFKLDGHADFAPVGSDIVCASASMLAATLFARVMNLLDEDDILECEMEPGHASLEICPLKAGNTLRCRHAFETIMDGFELLAQRYPEHVVID